MKTFAMTGGATGIGAALKQRLRDRGDRVLVVDLVDADVTADLSTAAGRSAGVSGISALAPEGLDGVVACAGIGPHTMPPSQIDRVNYFGAVAVLEGLRSLVAARRGAMLAVSSNSAPLPGLDTAHIDALLAADEERACDLVDGLDGHNAYAGSKNALARWVRRQAPAYMRGGVRLNAVAPGMTRTAMTDQVLQHEHLGPAMRKHSESIPYGEMATPDMIADAMLFLLSDAARFVCGVVLFVDGGQDALIRPDRF